MMYKIRYDQTALRNYGGLYGTNAYKSLGKKQKKLAWYLAYRFPALQVGKKGHFERSRNLRKFWGHREERDLPKSVDTAGEM